MNVYFDIIHPAHINLFKQFIKKLTSDGHKVVVLCLDRGMLPYIVKKELESVEVHVVGKHRGTKLSIIFQANMMRFFLIFIFLFFKDVNIGFSFGSFIFGAVLMIKRKPNIHLSDDPERKVNALLEIFTCTERYMPMFQNPEGKTKTFNALKEWAYLSPKYFYPDENVLSDYSIIKKRFIFVREVSTGSLNYLSQEENIILSISHLFPDEYQVVLSLEDKRNINLYPKSWIILKEPVADIHSIMYFSCAVVSSGDSMAREGAMLGVPSIYCGIRKMKANEILINKGMLFHCNIPDTITFIKKILKSELKLSGQKEFRETLFNEWTDINTLFNKILNNNIK